MKLNEIKNADRPTFATFESIGDSYTLELTEDPAMVVDPLNPDREMPRIVGVDDQGDSWQVNGRTQLPEAVAKAVRDAGVDEILVGGRLTVTYVTTRGRAKIHGAEYKAPAEC